MSEKRQVTWDYRIPLVTNKYILIDSAKVFGISGGVLLLILIAISGGRYLDQMLTLAVGVTGFLALLYVLVMVAVFGNGYYATFTVGDDGVKYSSGKRESRLSHGAVAVSLLLGSWKSLGPAVLGSSQLSGEFHWNNIRRVDIDEGSRVITLTDNWHVQCRLYCTPENYHTCVSIVEDHVAKLIKRD